MYVLDCPDKCSMTEDEIRSSLQSPMINLLLLYFRSNVCLHACVQDHGRCNTYQGEKVEFGLQSTETET